MIREQIRVGVADRGAGAEDRELEALVVGLGPVRQVGEPNERCADERAEELAGNEGRHIPPVRLVDRGEPDGDGGVQVSDPARDRDAREHTRHDGHRPRERDDDPAAVLRLGLVQQHAGDDSVTEQDEDSRPDDLSKEHLLDHPLIERPRGGARTVDISQVAGLPNRNVRYARKPCG